MDIPAFKRSHQSILRSISVLAGRAVDINTRGDAFDVRGAIEGIDEELVLHLVNEDQQLYPVLIDARDAAIRALGVAAFEDVGGLAGAWVQYRDQWTVEAILADPRRFAAATSAVLGALALRIEIEETSLYPAAEAAALLATGIVDAA